MVLFQKLRNLFLTLHGHNVHRQQRQLSKFLSLEKTHHAWCVFSKPCTKLTLHCNHWSGHLKTEHTESLFLLRRHLGNWPRSHEVSTSERTAGSVWETWTVAAANGVRCARVRWEINFLLTYETAPFICNHTVYLEIRRNMWYWVMFKLENFFLFQVSVLSWSKRWRQFRRLVCAEGGNGVSSRENTASVCECV